MKLCKKVLALMFVLLLAGCSAKADYPEMKAVDTAGLELAEAADSSVKFSYPADQWTEMEGSSPLTVAYNESLDQEYVCNLNVQFSQDYNGTLKEKDLKSMMDEMETYAGYMEVTTSELRLLAGEPVIYMECVTQFNDEYLDLLIEQGAVSEADIEAMGGREVFLNIPATEQIMMYAAVDGGLFVYVGTYYDDAQKQAVTDLMTVVIPTTKKAG